VLGVAWLLLTKEFGGKMEQRNLAGKLEQRNLAVKYQDIKNHNTSLHNLNFELIMTMESHYPCNL
jgi:hypothetical protein